MNDRPDLDGVLAEFFKELRQDNDLTQEDLAYRAGVGLRFIRDVEQGKKSLRLDKVNEVLTLFGYQMVPRRISDDE